MKKSLIVILTFSTLLLSCEKYDIPENYPTTFRKLSPGIINQMRSSYALKNQYVSSSINDFGFCDLIDDPLNVGTPPFQGIISKSEAIDIVKNFVSLNGDETGVKNPDDLTFSQTTATTGYGGSIGWHFRSSNQKVDTIEVMFSEILIHLTNSGVTLCYGNWYPGIIIPSGFNVSQNKALANLKGRVVSHYTIGGTEYHVTISKADLDNSTIGLKILPVEKEDKIELRVSWQINIPGPVFYIIYVDVMTGTIIRQVPTIIS